MLPQPNSDTLFVKWGSQPGIYSVTVKGMVGTGCTIDSVTYGVQILGLPQVQITGDMNVCAGQKITLTATGVSDVVWSNGVQGDVADFFPLGSTQIWARGTDGTCFSDTTYFTITPVPLPVAAFSANPLKGEAPLRVTFFDQSSHAASHEWDFGDGNTSMDRNPQNVYGIPGSYAVSLKVYNTAGCADSIRFEYIVAEEQFSWFVPNSFTPNGDYFNEYFRPYFPDTLTYTLSIFDRWGGEIYRTTSLHGRWDGNMDGRPVPQGVYVYRLNFRHPVTHKHTEKTGIVTLIR